MKAICLALLLVLSLQLQLKSHEAGNPLAGKTFTIQRTFQNNISGVDVTFSDTNVSFKACGDNSATYSVDGSKISTGGFSVTGSSCTKDNQVQ